MTIQTAKNKVKTAIGDYEFAKKNQLPVRAHYPSNALAAAKQKLTKEDATKLDAWYLTQNVSA